jgi:SARP family transcriptional regulator, regulator of embCAB operon
LAQDGQTRIQLCGRVAVEWRGRRVEDELPGRQGRLLFVYLAANRLREVRRDELFEALWGDGAPAAADGALRALLSKLRRTLGGDAVEGTTGLRLVLPADARVDLEAARDAIHRAESAVALGQWERAWGASQVALFTARRGFLPGEEAPWIDDWRRTLDELYLRALEAYAVASLEIRGTELAAAERAGRELIRLVPFRESGHRYLMRALAEQGNTAEALRTYERLRETLREEFGIVPSAQIRQLHARILQAQPS